ncbi:MAG: CBS domain-containing protein [Candidatus Micrarchaeia archaeon]
MVIIEIDALDAISSKIRSARIMLGLSQGTLARMAGVSQSTIARLEKDSKRLNPSYMMVYHIADVLNSASNKQGVDNMQIKELMNKKLIFAGPDDNIRKVLKIMRENDYSQIPVISNGKVIGTVHEKDILELIGSKSAKVREIMSTPLPEVDESTQIRMVKPILEEWGAVLVKGKRGIVGIFTIFDLLKALK